MAFRPPVHAFADVFALAHHHSLCACRTGSLPQVLPSSLQTTVHGPTGEWSSLFLCCHTHTHTHPYPPPLCTRTFVRKNLQQLPGSVMPVRDLRNSTYPRVVVSALLRVCAVVSAYTLPRSRVYHTCRASLDDLKECYVKGIKSGEHTPLITYSAHSNPACACRHAPHNALPPSLLQSKAKPKGAQCTDS